MHKKILVTIDPRRYGTDPEINFCTITIKNKSAMLQGSFAPVEHIETFLLGIKATLGTMGIHPEMPVLEKISPRGWTLAPTSSNTSTVEYDESERRTDELLIEISEGEAGMPGIDSIKIFGVTLSSPAGSWPEVFGSQEHLDIFIQGVKAVLEVMDTYPKIEFPLKIPSEIKVKYKKIIMNQQRLKV